MTVSSKKICAVLITLAIIALIPLLVISFYSHPQIDDYYYGIKTYHAVQEGSSVLGAAIDQVKETYTDWQGTYSAVFLFALHPAIWGENFYFISTFILLSAFIGSTFLLSYTVFKKYFKVSTPIYIIISTVISLISIEFVPNPAQSYYWWNGSVYYTFFYSLSLFLFSFLLIYLKSEKRGVRIACLTGCALLAAVLGGGNYITALFSVVILFLAICFLIYKKDKRAIAVSAVLAIFLIGFIISITAPGNEIRSIEENYSGNTPSAVQAIILSFFYSSTKILDWSKIVILFVILALFPILARCAASTNFKFKHPFVFFISTFIIFTTQFTPPIYAMNELGAERIINIIFYSFIWFLIANAFYFGGFLSVNHGFEPKKIIDFFKKPKRFISLLLIYISVVYVFLLGDYRYIEWSKYQNSATSSAVYSLFTGEAQRYDEIMNKRIEILKDDSVKDVEFEALEGNERPHILFYGEITDYKDFKWANRSVADYYDKNYVVAYNK